MDSNTLYNVWCENAKEDKDLIEELAAIKGNEDEIYERFYKNLEFGTAGLRGVIGAGTNRMNIYVVRQATQGLANYVNNIGGGAVAISHDSRIKADLFMNEAAKVLAANGIKAYITSELQPTPVLSFLVRHFGCKAGIMVTASHNPAKYNGYKAYGSDGCQMTDNAAGAVYDEMSMKDYKTDKDLIGKWNTEYKISYYYGMYQLDCDIEIKDNGIMTVHASNSDIGMDSTYYYAYSAENGKLTFKGVTDKDKNKATLEYKLKDGILTIVDKNNKTMFSESILGSAQFYKDGEKKPEGITTVTTTTAPSTETATQAATQTTKAK